MSAFGAEDWPLNRHLADVRQLRDNRPSVESTASLSVVRRNSAADHISSRALSILRTVSKTQSSSECLCVNAPNRQMLVGRGIGRASVSQGASLLVNAVCQIALIGARTRSIRIRFHCSAYVGHRTFIWPLIVCIH